MCHSNCLKHNTHTRDGSSTNLSFKRYSSSSAIGRKQAGVVLILLVLFIPATLVVCAIAVNIAYMELARTDMQIASDAASRASCRTYAKTGDEAAARDAANTAVNMNPILGKVVPLANGDLVFGSSVRSGTGKYVFTPNAAPFNAARVNLNALDGAIPLPLKFGLSISSFKAAQTATASQAEIDIALVVDRSGSMAFGSDESSTATLLPKRAPPGWAFGMPVPPSSRWEESLNAITVFLNVINQSPQREYINLVTYNHAPTFEFSLTDNYNLVATALNKYTVAFPEGGTNIGDGIYTALYDLENAPNKRDSAIPVIIVLTDGIHNYGSDPVGAAQTAASSNTIVYTVTFSQEADQVRMEQVAQAGGGKHFHATNGTELMNAFRMIAQELPVLTTE